jgi:hypothetical protein
MPLYCILYQKYQKTGHLISGQALKISHSGKLLEEGVQPIGAKINFLIGNFPAGAETPSAHPDLISQTEHKFPELIDVMQTV